MPLTTVFSAQSLAQLVSPCQRMTQAGTTTTTTTTTTSYSLWCFTQVTESTWEFIKDYYTAEVHEVQVKGKGLMTAYRIFPPYYQPQITPNPPAYDSDHIKAAGEWKDNLVVHPIHKGTNQAVVGTVDPLYPFDSFSEAPYLAQKVDSIVSYKDPYNTSDSFRKDRGSSFPFSKPREDSILSLESIKDRDLLVMDLQVS